MKDKVRVSYDVPIEEHTFLKTMCAKNRIPFSSFLRDMFHKLVNDLKKNKSINEVVNRKDARD